MTCQLRAIVFFILHLFLLLLGGSASGGRGACSRRLITLIFAGRSRIIVIRRELPRTRDAGSVGRRTARGSSKILLSVCLSTATYAASFEFFSFRRNSPYAACRRDSLCAASTLTPMAQIKPNNSRPTAVTTFPLFLPRSVSCR